tara:strand:+ start:7855 stop:8313 length:459 start_codon:yes stop_codon:yes gene_type:complete
MVKYDSKVKNKLFNLYGGIEMLKFHEGGDEITDIKLLDDNVIFVIFVALLLMGASGGGPYTDSSSITSETLPCHQIKGEVVFKEIEGDNHYLYVELFIDEEIDGYIVKVSEITYEAYELGETYEQITCDIGWFNMFKDTIQEMLDAGILEQF